MNKGFKLPCYSTDVPESDWMLKFVRNQLKGDPTKRVPKCTLTTPSERETKMSSSKFQLLSKLKALIECENVNGMQQEGRTQDFCLFEARHVSTHLILKMSMHHIFSTNISASSSRMVSNSSSMLAAGTCLWVLLWSPLVSFPLPKSLIFLEIHDASSCEVHAVHQQNFKSSL